MNKFTLFTSLLFSMLFFCLSATEDKTDSDHNKHLKIDDIPEEIIFIMTDNDDCPQGQYWPNLSHIKDLQGNNLPTDLVKICDRMHADVVQTSILLDEAYHLYLGKFINTAGETIYLYDKIHTEEQENEPDDDSDNT